MVSLPMDFKKYREETKADLPPNLDAGTILNRIERIEHNTFKLNGNDKKGMRIFADGKEYRTSSGVIMEQLDKFFSTNAGQTLDNVKVVQPRGKKYLTLEAL